jgi:hypothetical protein
MQAAQPQSSTKRAAERARSPESGGPRATMREVAARAEKNRERYVTYLRGRRPTMWEWLAAKIGRS